MTFNDDATKRVGRHGSALKLSLVDIRKAYVNGVPKRKVYLMLPPELGLPSGTLGFLIRCAYGTRDAGAIWEETYAEALIELGFTRGVASPCCFHHKDRDIGVVVHGDDFTTIGEAEDLDWYEKGLASFFELKVRARLGPDETDDQEVRILNRIVRVTPSGLSYEADPRHVEILIKSLGVENAKSVSSPGVKDYSELELETEDAEANEHLVAALRADVKPGDHGRTTSVRFNDDVETYDVIPYGEIYGLPPRQFVVSRWATLKRVSELADRFTGKSQRIMQHRMNQLQFGQDGQMRYREEILKHVIEQGAAWELSSDMRIAIVAAVKSKKKLGQQRLGVKKVKDFERLQSKGEVLCPDEATAYRALATMANDLAMDLPDIAFATKELCR